MTSEDGALVPVWSLSTEPVGLPEILNHEGMTPARLAEVRTVLATLADSPIVTLEAYRNPEARDRSGGILLHSASPLAKQLSQLVADTAKSAPSALKVGASGDTLYRMVVPGKVAAEFGKGLIRPMAAKSGGIHGALVGSAGVAAQASFVPVAGAATAGAAGGSAATAGAAAASAGALTVAAPLVLMAVAVGVSAYADQQRQKSIERITELLEQLHEDKLENERGELDGCRDAIEKATSVLLDRGRVGASLGLDSASFAISKSLELTRHRLARWKESLASLGDGPVGLTRLSELFPGVGEVGGEFRAQVELARLAIALKRRVLVLQAVEHAQAGDEANPFKSFISALREDERRVDQLESDVNGVLLRLSTLELRRQGGVRKMLSMQREFDELLTAVYRLRELGDDVHMGGAHADVAIEIERSNDGSVLVFPAQAV